MNIVENNFEDLMKTQIEERIKYPHGISYDNLFNAEHRAVMIERYGSTEATWITLEELLLSK